MNNKALLKELKSWDACGDAVEWVAGKDLKTAWDTCERANWMLWFMVKAKLATKRERIHVICDCAETALKYVLEGEDRPRLAIEAARRCADNPTRKNRDAVRAAAYAVACAANVVTYTAVDAAACAAYTNYTADIANTVANAVTNVAVFANFTACTTDVIRKQVHTNMCNIIRKKIKV